MFEQVRYQFSQKPAWYRFLMITITVVLTATLFWVGIIVVFSLALIAMFIAVINRIKVKLTGRPLFTGPKHFHRYQSHFNKDNVIEGEVLDSKEDKTES